MQNIGENAQESNYSTDILKWKMFRIYKLFPAYSVPEKWAEYLKVSNTFLAQIRLHFLRYLFFLNVSPASEMHVHDTTHMQHGIVHRVHAVHVIFIVCIALRTSHCSCCVCHVRHVMLCACILPAGETLRKNMCPSVREQSSLVGDIEFISVLFFILLSSRSLSSSTPYFQLVPLVSRFYQWCDQLSLYPVFTVFVPPPFFVSN